MANIAQNILLSDADLVVGYYLYHTGNGNHLLPSAARQASQLAKNRELISLYRCATNSESNIFTWANYGKQQREDRIVEVVGRDNFNLIVKSPQVVEEFTPRQDNLYPLSADHIDEPSAYDAVLSYCQSIDKPMPIDDVTSAVVSLFNGTHSVVRHGSKTLIAEAVIDFKGNRSYEFSAVPQMRNLYLNMTTPVEVQNGAGIRVKRENAFDLWLKDLKRRTYAGVAFDPSNRAGGRFLNLWDGFAISPCPGRDRIERIMWHLKHIVCDGNDEHFEYLLAWLAHIVQKPEEKSGVCVVLKSGARGTGKSTVSVLIERLLGHHAMRIQDGKHLLGAFNGHLANKLVVTIEEAFWAGSSKDAGKLRSLITESTITLEAKGKDAIEIDSYHRFIMCTNNDWAVPQSADERRFFVLEVSEEKKQDPGYFRELYTDIQSDEAVGQLLNFLSTYDLKAFNLRKAPRTAATAQQMLESMPVEAHWLKGVLEDGFLVDGGITYELVEYKKVPKAALFNDYIDYCNKLNVSEFNRLTRDKLGRYLVKAIGVMGGGRMPSNLGRGWAYSLPSIEQMRLAFSEHYNVPIETMFD